MSADKRCCILKFPITITPAQGKKILNAIVQLPLADQHILVREVYETVRVLPKPNQQSAESLRTLLKIKVNNSAAARISSIRTVLETAEGKDQNLKHVTDDPEIRKLIAKLFISAYYNLDPEKADKLDLSGLKQMAGCDNGKEQKSA